MDTTNNSPIEDRPSADLVWEHVTVANLPSSPNPFSQSGRRGAGLKSLSPKNGDKWERDFG